MPNVKPYSLPITLGVTGHRQIAPDDVEVVQQAVDAVLSEVSRNAPTTPILLLSGLAEGADRLVARIAIEKHGARLVAVLPMTTADFRQDFATDDSKAEFDDLLAMASQVIIPMKADRTSPEERRTGYQTVGEWIALHSHLLIALWDGDTAHGRGGTAEIVAAKLKGRYSINQATDLLRYDEGGAVAHIHTTRPDQPPTPGGQRIKWLYPEIALIGAKSGKRRFDFVLGNFERLNRNLLRAGRTKEGWVASQSVPRAMNIEALKAAASHFAAAFQRHTHASVLYMACATMVAALASPFESKEWSLVATVVGVAALVSGFLVWTTAHRKQWQRLHTDLRAISEACRVQSVWLACGIRQCVADQYHPVQAASVQWIRRAMRTVWLLDGLASPLEQPTTSEPNGFAAGRQWVEEQKAFFLGRHGVVPQYDRRARHFARLSITFLAIGLFVWVGGGLLGVFPDVAFRDSRGHLLFETHADQTLLDVGKIVLACGASLHAYQVFMAFGDLQRSYAISAHLFSIASQELERIVTSGDKTGFRRLIFELGRAALVENVSWLLTRRQRHLMPPVG